MRPGGWLPRLEPGNRPHCFGGPDGETVRSLENLSVANRRFGGARSVLGPLCTLLKCSPPGLVRVLDVGCGGADLPRALSAWARHHGAPLQITAVDRDPIVAAQARAACVAWPEIHIVQADARRLPFRASSFHYVTSSMLLHYFDSAEAAMLLSAWRMLASRAVVVGDVHRHWFPYLAIHGLGRVSRSPLFSEGHARTVRRGFTPGELVRLGSKAGFARLRVRRHAPFRLSLVGLV